MSRTLSSLSVVVSISRAKMISFMMHIEQPTELGKLSKYLVGASPGRLAVFFPESLGYKVSVSIGIFVLL